MRLPLDNANYFNGGLFKLNKICCLEYGDKIGNILQDKTFANLISIASSTQFGMHAP